MRFRVQVYVNVDGSPMPQPAQTVLAYSSQKAAELACGEPLSWDGPHAKLAALVWLEGDAPGRWTPFYRP